MKEAIRIFRKRFEAKYPDVEIWGVTDQYIEEHLNFCIDNGTISYDDMLFLMHEFLNNKCLFG